MKETPNFISIYDNALTKNECELIINEFESNKDIQVEGKSGNYEVQPKVKKSIDIGETQYIENRFFYDKTENESYTNRSFYILQHSGYDIMEIKDWEDETDISN